MRSPYLKKQGSTKVLMVDDHPFVMLAGELHNSNSSTPEAMEASCRKAVELGVNSVIATLSWELIEPEEGCFDFSTVDMVIDIARKHGLKLELIWFGSWKNAQCAYAPAWVKKDLNRFPRAEMQKGKRSGRMEILGAVNYTTLSYLSEEACKADARAFQAVMAHIREIDSRENTVLMMQVENETGVLTAAREHADLADRLFYGPAPAELVQYLKAHTENMADEVRAAVEEGADAGTWEACFGPVAEEIFSAYYVSSYVNRVAAAGKEAYDIPMTANCWLEQGKAGEYPSGGPIARVMEVWQFAAPSIDILAPDIYTPAFCAVCESYTKNGNPLFIPETATHAYAGVRQLYAVGRHHAVCYAPFGFEDIGKPFLGMSGVGMDLTDPALRTRQDAEEYRQITTALRSMLHKITPEARHRRFAGGFQRTGPGAEARDGRLRLYGQNGRQRKGEVARRRARREGIGRHVLVALRELLADAVFQRPAKALLGLSFRGGRLLRARRRLVHDAPPQRRRNRRHALCRADDPARGAVCLRGLTASVLRRQNHKSIAGRREGGDPFPVCRLFVWRSLMPVCPWKTATLSGNIWPAEKRKFD